MLKKSSDLSPQVWLIFSLTIIRTVFPWRQCGQGYVESSDLFVLLTRISREKLIIHNNGERRQRWRQSCTSFKLWFQNMTENDVWKYWDNCSKILINFFVPEEELRYSPLPLVFHSHRRYRVEIFKHDLCAKSNLALVL